ncbi:MULTISPECIES: tetratricopeptide repeat protein [unclassified Pasteurella]|uniref:tetratricopeptide repeat protein n=1 Tax=unclassified Pasteurella TaxID=2621516 RepID=UPI00107408C1|nr:sel1 repeat family protein [Pasteurella sp. 19428wF3_WM03]TFU50272.1 sel1 repeat family protein [Pasteurella sp. WM03]
MKFNKTTLFFTALFAFSTATLSPVAFADSKSQFNQAVTAYENQSYTTAFNLFKPLAEQGHAAAQFNLGLMYAKGRGVRQDDHQAKYWAGKSCENGNQDGCDIYRILNEGEIVCVKN